MNTDNFDPFNSLVTFNELAAEWTINLPCTPAADLPQHFVLATPEPVRIEVASLNDACRLTIHSSEAEQFRIGDVLHQALSNLFGQPLMDCQPEPAEGCFKLTGWRPDDWHINHLIHQDWDVSGAIVQTLVVKRAA
jgi:hypothetical protein